MIQNHKHAISLDRHNGIPRDRYKLCLTSLNYYRVITAKYLDVKSYKTMSKNKWAWKWYFFLKPKRYLYVNLLKTNMTNLNSSRVQIFIRYFHTILNSKNKYFTSTSLDIICGFVFKLLVYAVLILKNTKQQQYITRIVRFSLEASTIRVWFFSNFIA